LGLRSELLQEGLNSISEDVEGNLWIGSSYRGLIRVTKKWIDSITAKDGLSHSDVWSFWEMKDDSVLIAGSRGVDKLALGHITPVFTTAPENAPMSQRSLMIDHLNRLWLGSAFKGSFRKPNAGNDARIKNVGGAFPQTHVFYQDR
jgi:ligand-binding sensor domain-containing protein